MHLSALLLVAGLGMAALFPAYAGDSRPQSNNPNVKRAMKKSKNFKPAKYKPYKSPKRSKKPARVKYV